MGRVSLLLVVSLSLCTVVSAGTLSRSSGYSGYGYGKQAPPAVAANGGGSRYGSRSGYYGGSADATKLPEQVKGSTPTKKSGGSGMSAWGIIAIVLTVCLSLMGVYYFTIFYPLLCRKERKYDVMELGSQ